MLYLEVYPDIVFLINFFIDLILIFLLKKVNKKHSSKLRMTLAAMLGAVSAVIIAVFPWMNEIYKFIIMYLLASILMIFIAFGKLSISDLIKQWIVLNLITYFVGGLMNSIYYHTKLRALFIIGKGNVFSNISIVYVVLTIVIITIIALFVIWLLRLYQIHKPLIYDVELILQDRRVLTKGLMDTGNCLYDPFNKSPVMVIENTLMEDLLTDKIKQEMDKAKSYLNGEIDEIPWNHEDNAFPFSFIPYRSVGKTGMLLTARLDKVMVFTGKESICNEKVTVAICDNRLTGNDDYHVILHKELL